MRPLDLDDLDAVVGGLDPKSFWQNMPRNGPSDWRQVPEYYGAIEHFLQDRYGRSGEPSETYHPPSYDPETGKIRDGYFDTPKEPGAPSVPISTSSYEGGDDGSVALASYDGSDSSGDVSYEDA